MARMSKYLTRLFSPSLRTTPLSIRKGSGALYPKVYAIALPLVLPLLVATHWLDLNPLTADWKDDLALQVGEPPQAVAGGVDEPSHTPSDGSAEAATTTPSSAPPTRLLAGRRLPLSGLLLPRGLAVPRPREAHGVAAAPGHARGFLGQHGVDGRRSGRGGRGHRHAGHDLEHQLISREWLVGSTLQTLLVASVHTP